ncbi:MAG TPA: hypothetical protein PLK12_04265 [Prolixibacteraceae bacterium]|nr:hypothetical protein [Prolixibacteraceae bacterium]
MIYFPGHTLSVILILLGVAAFVLGRIRYVRGVKMGCTHFPSHIKAIVLFTFLGSLFIATGFSLFLIIFL